MLLLPSVITAREARDVQQLLAQGLARESDTGVVIDAANLKNFDSAALAVMLECRRLAESVGKTLDVRNASPKLASLAKLYGVDSLLLAKLSAPV